MAYLDENGLEHFWGKIKDHVDSAIAPKADDADVLHKTGTETVSGEKVFSGIQTTAAGNETALMVVKDATLVKGETPATNHFLTLGFIDSTGDSYAQDVSSRLGAVEYKSPSEANPNGYMQLADFGFNGGGSAILQVGHDENNVQYATAPATSGDRTNSTDIVTRGYMEASEWNWQKTEKAKAVTFKPVPESDLEPVVDFIFTETPPVEGEKGPENPSTIAGVNSAMISHIGGDNLLAYNFSSASVPNGTTSNRVNGIIVSNNNGVYSLSGTATGRVNTYITYEPNEINKLKIPAGTYTLSGFTAPVNAPEGTYLRLQLYNINTGAIFKTIDCVNGNKTFTIENPCYCNVYIRTDTGTVYQEGFTCSPQLEIGSNATAFKPSVVSDYTIQLGDTYYGGSLDVATGVMTVTWGAKTIDGTESFSRDATYSTDTVSVFTSQLGLPQSVMSNNQSATTRFCSHFLWSNSIIADTYSTWGTATNALFKLSASEYPDVTSFKNWLASEYSADHPVILGFLLNNPYTVQLTPTQIRSLPALDKYESRINTVYTDQEAVQVGYQRFANYVDLTTDQTIDGDKNFIKGVRIDNLTIQRLYSSSPAITILPPVTINDGSHRGSSFDALSARVADGTSSKRLGCVRCYDISSNGNRTIGFYPFDINNDIATSLLVGILDVAGNNPVPYAVAPSTPKYEPDGVTERTEGRDIVTRNWIPKDTRIVHTTGDETITGNKTFSSGPQIKATNLDVTNSSTSQDLWRGLSWFDVNNKTVLTWSTHYGGSERTFSLRLTDSSITSHYLMYWGMNHDGTNPYVVPGGDLYPTVDNAYYCGKSNRRWKSVYAVNGTIQTSDERVKEDIASLSDSVLDAWDSVEWQQFRMKASIERKGSSARLHSGIIAQRVRDAFVSAGLDASNYGFFCFDQWDEVPAQLDEQGNVAVPAIPAGEQYSIRYDEALALEAAYMRRENARLKKRVADLEERLAALELKIS